jgi:hypothetical protein
VRKMLRRPPTANRGDYGDEQDEEKEFSFHKLC